MREDLEKRRNAELIEPRRRKGEEQLARLQELRERARAAAVARPVAKPLSDALLYCPEIFKIMSKGGQGHKDNGAEIVTQT